MKNQADSNTDRDEAIIRDILVRVGESEHINQRTLAKELGIALGMTNTYVKRCVRKGLVKVSQAPPNRYLYYLTPRGFAEKSRLTAEFMSDSLVFFRRARSQYAEIFEDCRAAGWQRLAFSGVSELGEIAVLYARDRNLEPIGIVDSTHLGGPFMDLPVVSSVEQLPDPDALVVTSVNAPQQAYDNAISVLGAARVLAPPLLSVDRYGSSAVRNQTGDA